jgi:MoaA/NifB/PqqE/SkfB family radical SAM enzyme
MAGVCCQACMGGTPMTACAGAFANIGVIKAHWECWSECNLRCGFCYRTRGKPLNTDAALTLMRAIRFGGCESIVFAGGDPSLRADIGDLVLAARGIGLKVEIQTNADHVWPAFRQALQQAELVGLSLDGARAETHDELRGRSGNQANVLAMLRSLERDSRPVIVRSVVVRRNLGEFSELAEMLSKFRNIVRWSVLEFSPVGEGYRRTSEFGCADAEFDSAAAAARGAWTGSGQLNVFRNSEKSGVYLLITPDGLAYGTTATPSEGAYPVVGSIVEDHLATLASALPLAADRHQSRYKAMP